MPGPARDYRPARIVIRLNDHNTPAGIAPARGAAMPLKEWRRILVDAIHWLGPVRVTFSGGEPARARSLEDLVRFANRLECPTHVVTSGAGLDRLRVEELVDRGVGAVTVLIGALEPDLHRAVVGAELEQTLACLDHLRDVRADRDRAPEILAAIPLIQENLASIGEIAAAARQRGADGALGCLPPGSRLPDGAREALAALGDMDRTPASFKATMGGRRAQPMPGGPRLEIRSDGAMLLSPLLPPIADLTRQPIREAWESGVADAVEQARALEYPWDEVELAPRLLLSRR